MKIELIGLRSSWRSQHDILRGALETAERRQLQAYRITEHLRSGPLVRLQVGSSST